MAHDWPALRALRPLLPPELQPELDRIASGDLPDLPASGRWDSPPDLLRTLGWGVEHVFRARSGRMNWFSTHHAAIQSPLAAWLTAWLLRSPDVQSTGSLCWVILRVFRKDPMKSNFSQALCAILREPLGTADPEAFPWLAENPPRESPHLAAVGLRGLTHESAVVRAAALSLLSRAPDRIAALQEALPGADPAQRAAWEAALADLSASPAAPLVLDRSPLEAACAAWQANDPDRALLALLTAWEATRSPEIAAKIDEVSATLDPRPVTAKSLGEAQSRWLSLASSKNPRVIGDLLAGPWPKTWPHALERVEALRGFPPDPRVARALGDLVRALPYTAQASTPLWRAAVGLLVALQDARTFDALLGLKRFGPWWLQSALRNADDLAVPPALSERDLDLLDRIGPRHAVDPAEMLAEIREDPDDDGLRLVLADILSQAGDPRGEFIVLQCARAAGRGTKAGERQEKALLRTHREAWLGSLAGITREVTFERGFPEHLSLTWRRDLDPSEPALVGVRTLVLHAAPGDEIAPPLSFVRGIPSLRGLHNLGANSEIIRSDLPLESVSIRTSGPAIDARNFRLPALRSFGFLSSSGAEPVYWTDIFLRAPFAARLSSFSVSVDPSTLGEWSRGVRRGPESLRRVDLFLGLGESVLSPEGWRVTLVRDEAGAFSTLELSWHLTRHDRTLHAFDDIVSRLPSAAISRVILHPSRVFTVPPPGEGGTDLRALLRGAIRERFRTAEHVFPW